MMDDEIREEGSLGGEEDEFVSGAEEEEDEQY